MISQLGIFNGCILKNPAISTSIKTSLSSQMRKRGICAFQLLTKDFTDRRSFMQFTASKYSSHNEKIRKFSKKIKSISQGFYPPIHLGLRQAVNWTLLNSSTFTLRDGTKVSEIDLIEVIRALETISEQNYSVFFNLVKKCKDHNYNWDINTSHNAKEILTKWELLDEDGKIRNVVKSILLEAIERGLFLEFDDPRKKI